MTIHLRQQFIHGISQPADLVHVYTAQSTNYYCTVYCIAPNAHLCPDHASDAPVNLNNSTVLRVYTYSYVAIVSRGLKHSD